MLAAFAVHERHAGIFACPAAYGKSPSLLVECNATDYGEYYHGAVWFGLARQVRKNAAAANVLFLGNSRMQFALSSQSTDDWFVSRKVSYYLFGFDDEESVQFTAPILAEIKPQAKAYVINVDRFFREDLSPYAVDLVSKPNAQQRVELKSALQPIHRMVCTVLSKLCGRSPAMFAKVENGQWTVAGLVPRFTIERADWPVDEAKVAQWKAVAEPFIESLPVDRSCVVLTYVWTTANDRADAEALAQSLGVAFVSPQLAGLTTIDESHLDRPSAERFSYAFFEQAAPYLSHCLDGARTASPAEVE
jgi:hypothetical protein